MTSPSTEEVALNLASSKLCDTSGDSRMRRGAGGRLSEPKASFLRLTERQRDPEPKATRLFERSEFPSPVRAQRVLGLRAKRAGTQALDVCTTQELLGFPPGLPYSTPWNR